MLRKTAPPAPLLVLLLVMVLFVTVTFAGAPMKIAPPSPPPLLLVMVLFVTVRFPGPPMKMAPASPAAAALSFTVLFTMATVLWSNASMAPPSLALLPSDSVRCLSVSPVCEFITKIRVTLAPLIVGVPDPVEAIVTPPWEVS